MTKEQYERFYKIVKFLKSEYDKKLNYKIIDINNNYIKIDLKEVKKRNIYINLLRKLDKLKNKNLKLDFDNKINIAIINKKREVKK